MSLRAAAGCVSSAVETAELSIPARTDGSEADRTERNTRFGTVWVIGARPLPVLA